MRKHLAWYLQGLKGASRVKTDINNAPEAAEVLRLLNEYRRELTGGNEQ
jgi:tRNA-dihydrouridine synthase